MSYDGIDYGLGKTNIDTENGIRFGCINANSVDSWLWEEVETVYPECDESELDENGEIPEDFYEMLEPIGYEYNRDGLHFEISSDDNDIIILKSPYTSTGTFCSPCFPGGVSLGTDGNVRCYALPPDWFSADCPIPYKVEKL